MNFSENKKAGDEAVGRAKQAVQEGYWADAIEDYRLALDYYSREMARFNHDVSATRLFSEIVRMIMNEVRQLSAQLEKDDTSGGGRRRRKPLATSSTGSAGGGGELEAAGEGNAFEQEILRHLLEKEGLPAVGWDDVIGLDGVKETLRVAERLERELAHLMPRETAMSLLLYGPTGVGKTLLVKALARERSSAFFSLSATTLISKWVGDSPKYITAMFNVVKQHRPAILFIDEIDALLPDRESSSQQSEESKKAVSQFLIECNGITQDSSMDGVLLIGATNLPWHLDVGALRRFTRRIYIPLPDCAGRFELLRHYLHKKTGGDVGQPIPAEELWAVASECENYSPKEIEDVVTTARAEKVQAILSATHFKPAQYASDPTNPGAMTRCLLPCEADDPAGKPVHYDTILQKEWIQLPRLDQRALLQTLSQIKPVVTRERLAEYEAWTEKHGEKDKSFIGAAKRPVKRGAQKIDSIEDSGGDDDDDEDKGA
jgi:vacuolar protein-sorting-associated protein 4